ncbi:MAG TPA: efflux RND transporter periplasmic adaptor subunit [Burkholderiales bacterium]|nr:efflux RND transporter periplasmic adaptor subunit [Burkholderiales bacterium]
MLRLQMLRRNMPPRFSFPLSPRFVMLALPAAVLLAACGPQEGGQHGFPPSPVSAMTVTTGDIPVEYEYVAQTAGSREVEIRARVTGILLKRNYTEGGMVKAGQSLFTLDLAPYEIAAAKAEADLASAEASLAQSQRQAVRLKPLIEANAVSQKDYDDATSGAQVAAANVKSARSQLNQAKLNLQYARVDSPITGLASRALKSEGALVSGPDVLLTTVSQVNPIYVNFGVPDSDQLKLRNDIASGAVKLPNDGKLDVQVKYPDGTAYPQTGKMDFSDVRINPSTGMSDSRAELPNPDLALRPGMFVRVHLSGAVRVNAIKVPQRAVLEGPGGNGKMVYLVASDGKGGNIAQPRPVEVGDWVGDSWIVRSGLKPGDQVITEGMSKIFFPGAPVALGPPPGAPGAAGNGKGGPGEAGKAPAAQDAGKADAAKAAPDAAKK